MRVSTEASAARAGVRETRSAGAGLARCATGAPGRTVAGMDTDTPTSDAGSGLLVAMTVATVLCTLLIAGFSVLATWWLLPILIATLLVTAAGLAVLLVKIMGDDGVGTH